MGVVALISWLVTASGGLYLLAIWLIEYDRGYQSAAATRLPIPVISTHAFLALTGVFVWGAYLLLDADGLAWIAVGILTVVTTLGLVMASRWLKVYQSSARPARQAGRSRRARVTVPAGGLPPGDPAAADGPPPVPPERSFPVPVVILHGLFAAVTIVLVVLTALDLGGS
ncbi:MAG TPA: hypothetical protein VFV41_29305 [Streptosporangiaceae bacterium]|nr:hypothetical protein [Streptosporangiaceae bacterium]